MRCHVEVMSAMEDDSGQESVWAHILGDIHGEEEREDVHFELAGRLWEV